MTIGGTTPSEKYLSYLCHQSFLSLWSFPNVFNDDGVVNGKGIGKEICDLLVVFGNDVLIFSDKSCEYKNTGRLAIDWNRWYRKSIEKSAHQLYGAERWIKSFPERIFLDPAAKNPFPIEFPDQKKMRVHRIAVALGAKEQCKAFYDGGSGSLRISTDQSPIMDSDEEFLKAFTVGHFDKAKGYVHVFDDITIDIILRELNTVSDFCAYLRKKEELISNAIVVAGGEEELLGLYLKNLDPDGHHGFGIDYNEYDAVMLPEGEWEELCSNPQYIAKKKADEASAIWDSLIEYFNKCHRVGNLREEITTRDYEKAIRKMAALSRVERRMVGKKLHEIFQTTLPYQTRYSALLTDKKPKFAFAFVLFPPHPERSYDEYLEVRRALLAAYCNILKHRNPTLLEVVGLAFEPYKPGRGGSEELAYFDVSTWSEENGKQAEEDMQNLGIKGIANFFTESEYPAIPASGKP